MLTPSPSLRWLTDPADTGLRVDDLPAGTPIVAPRGAADRARGIPVADDGDPLVPVAPRLAVHDVYAQLGFTTKPPQVQLRSAVLDQLVAAQAQLPAGLTLVVIDGWRTRAFQRELRDHYAPRYASLDGFVSDPDDADLVPPHVTGGAVDLTLAAGGHPLALGTDFDAFEDAAAVDWFERTDGFELVRRLRRCLATALLGQGLTPLAEEWWHWSSGDQRWADHHGLAASRYSAVDG